MYLDESGTPDTWHQQSNFVLAGVAVHEGQVKNISDKLDDIQKQYFPNIHIPIAFHAFEIVNKKGRFKKINRATRIQLMDDLFDLFCTFRFPNMVAFATVIHISAVQRGQTLHATFEDVCSRFNTMLVRQYNAGYPDKGLLIIDRSHESDYRKMVADFQESGTTHIGYLGNVIDIPYFASRHQTRMLQIADFCAYGVYQYYENSNRRYFDKVLTCIDRRSPGHSPDGLKHIIDASQNCNCEACSWR